MRPVGDGGFTPKNNHGGIKSGQDKDYDYHPFTYADGDTDLNVGDVVGHRVYNEPVMGHSHGPTDVPLKVAKVVHSYYDKVDPYYQTDEIQTGLDLAINELKRQSHIGGDENFAIVQSRELATRTIGGKETEEITNRMVYSVVKLDRAVDEEYANEVYQSKDAGYGVALRMIGDEHDLRNVPLFLDPPVKHEQPNPLPHYRKH